MQKPINKRSITKSALLCATVFTALGMASAQAQEAATNDSEVVVVKGYRGSLQSSASAKKRAVGFTDSVFAEDMGKFPDNNLAESFNRIPGVVIQREITGEGTSVAVRGLGPSFTRVLLNGAPVSVGSTGNVDTNNSNREVDMDIFPPELFTQLTVIKSPSASLVEGGASGTVNMRQARPFDFKGDRIQFSLGTSKSELSDDYGYKGTFLVSKKFGNWGIIAGVAHTRLAIAPEGFESIGWTNPNLSATQNTGTRNSTGGGNWTIPGTVPATAGAGLTAGTTIDQAFLLANNPGATITQIDNGLLPRLGRPMHYYGTRERTSAILGLEFRPNDSMRFWFDAMMAKKTNDTERTDINWIGRNGSFIPLNTKYDRSDCTNGCLVTAGTYTNAQFFLEYRPWTETNEFKSFNPGFSWDITDNLKLTVDANYTASDFRRDSPTVLVNSPFGTVSYANDLSGAPTMKFDKNLNDPTQYSWTGGRVNIQSEARKTQTRGLHADLKWGGPEFNIQLGYAYDDMSRTITPYDNSQAWQNATCGNNPSVVLPGGNANPPCRGDVITGTSAAVNTANSAYPSWPGYGTGSTQGATPGSITYGGSLIPQANLASYLSAGPYGYVTLNWDKFAQDSKYYQYLASAPIAGGSNISSPRSHIREKVDAAYVQVNGDRDLFGMRLRYDFGIRAITTKQTIAGQVSVPDPRNTPAAPAVAPAEGGKYPSIVSFRVIETNYKNYLPSASFALNFTDSLIGRASMSHTMTRANPGQMLPGLSFGSPSADTGSLGNTTLEPYISKNTDLGLEYYTGKEGFVALTYFNKKITGFTSTQLNTYPFSYLAQYGVTYDTLNPTQQTAINLRGGPAAANVTLSQPVNNNGLLTINGIELTWVQPLGQFFEPLDGFGYTTNYTLIKQKATAGSSIAFGVPKTTYNVTGYYEKHGYSFRISKVYRDGSQVGGLGQNGIALAGLYEEPYQQVDLSASVDLKEAFGFGMDMDVTFEAVNITDEKITRNFQFDGAIYSQYRAGTTYMLGVRGKF